MQVCVLHSSFFLRIMWDNLNLITENLDFFGFYLFEENFINGAVLLDFISFLKDPCMDFEKNNTI